METLKEIKTPNLGGKTTNRKTNIFTYRVAPNYFVLGEGKSGEGDPGQKPSEGRGDYGNGVGGRGISERDQMNPEPDRRNS